MRIPLHCLVLCADHDQLTRFPVHEHLARASIAYELVGLDRRIDLGRIAFAEMRHRLGLKLSLGERVVVASDDLSTDCKEQLVSIARDQGAHIIGIGERLRHCEYCDSTVIPIIPFSAVAREQYHGITVIGDIHGDLDLLRQAFDWARSRQHYAWLLGDVLDYGKQSLECAEAVYQAVMRGDAGLIIGNHERKIARWIEQRHVRISDGNRVTTDALMHLKSSERERWIGRFRALLAHACLLHQMDNITLIHAAAHPSLWADRPDQQLIEQFGLYGQGEVNGKFRRVHHWIDVVPKGNLVFVGHDVLSPFPMVVTGAKGGQVVFLDTGCGKGGVLSTADLRFGDAGLRLECFNRHGS